MSSLPHAIRRRRRRDVRRLLHIPTFRDGNPRRLAKLLPHTDHLRLPPGRTVVRSGETVRELIAIEAGEAAVFGPNGEVAVLRPGAEIGARQVLRGERHVATVVALTDLDVVVVNGPAVRWAHQEGLAHAPAPSSRQPQQRASYEPSLVPLPPTVRSGDRQTVTS